MAVKKHDVYSFFFLVLFCTQLIMLVTYSFHVENGDGNVAICVEEMVEEDGSGSAIEEIFDEDFFKTITTLSSETTTFQKKLSPNRIGSFPLRNGESSSLFCPPELVL